MLQTVIAVQMQQHQARSWLDRSSHVASVICRWQQGWVRCASERAIYMYHWLEWAVKARKPLCLTHACARAYQAEQRMAMGSNCAALPSMTAQRLQSTADMMHMVPMLPLLQPWCSTRRQGWQTTAALHPCCYSLAIFESRHAQLITKGYKVLSLQ